MACHFKKASLGVQPLVGGWHAHKNEILGSLARFRIIPSRLELGRVRSETLLSIAPQLLLVLMFSALVGCGSKPTDSGLGSRGPVASLEEVESREDGVYLLATGERFEGTLREVYPDGSVKAEASFVNGMLQGPTVGFHPNGNVQIEEAFHQGVSHGTRRRFREDGSPITVERVRNGELHGAYERFHANGTLAEQAEYIDGKPHGLARAWDESGRLTAEVTFENGKVVQQDFAADFPPSRGTQP